jgi:hypothetical protein
VPTPPDRPPLFDGPPDRETDPLRLLLGYLDWYRAAVLRKLEGLSDEQLTTPLPALGWAPLTIVQHLGYVERRWLRWGFLAEPLEAYPLGEAGEWRIDEPPSAVLERYRDQIAESDRILSTGSDGPCPFESTAAAGGRFATADETPTLGRILVHLLQEYARHTGHVDIARQLIDGAIGE